VFVPPVYPIIDIDFCRMRRVDPLALTSACLDGGARLLQVRMKSGGGAELLDVCRAAVAVGAPFGARIIVNDRADIAAMSGAAGVHVGQNDLPAADARTIAGDGAIVGVSTHTEEQIDDAAGGAADYIAVGPVFPTTTKETGFEPRGLALVRYAVRSGKPVIGIGGITAANAAAVIDAGAAAVAMISDLLAEERPEERIRALLASLAGGGFNV
jgi:thiamine-phosphate pyrophosphorylase